jgi:PTH1 family peptidyl-tRNA hydrolase
MLLFVGLGNPVASYAHHRHNVGFMALDAIAQRWSVGPWRRRFQGVAAEGSLGGERVVFLEPGTYMNESGRSVGEAAHFYKIQAHDIVVFHDEIDLPLGKIRVKAGGGTAGHNGLRSISAHVGNEYRRVRIGVGHPGDKALVQLHVLSAFGKAERDWVGALCAAIAENAPLLARREDATFQNKVHLALAAKGLEPRGPDAAREP